MSLTDLPSAPPVVVVDNGSDDGTPTMVRDSFPTVDVIPLSRNHGALARNLGVAVANTAYVAFADDDSWWEPGALSAAAEMFESNPRLGVVAAQVRVGPDRRLDPVCRTLAAGKLGRDAEGHPHVLGFVACGTVVRRVAFLEAGGFDRLLFFLGEEGTLALDMAQRGWELVYASHVVAVHHPGSVSRDTGRRVSRQTRNDVLAAVIHRPWKGVARQVSRQGVGLLIDRHVRAGLIQAAAHLPGAVARRRPVSPSIEDARRRAESSI